MLLQTAVYAEQAQEQDSFLPVQQAAASDRQQAIQSILNNTPAVTGPIFSPAESIVTSENDFAVINQKNVSFENGDYFWSRRYVFKKTTDGFYTSAVALPGNTLEIRYVDPETKQWVFTSKPEDIKDKKTTLYINTDSHSAIIGVPGVYKNIFAANTLEVIKEKESSVSITKEDGSYGISFKFPQDSSLIGEIWCIQSPNQLIDWTNPSDFENLKVHDLALERRWSWDGYYFKTPSNYTPSGENVLYRHPANYTGAAFVKNETSLAAKDLGYVMTKTCLKNQNQEGYWETGPESAWLKADFDIGGNFYDTRFSTDFALSLIYAYRKYNDKAFLEGAVKYAEYFMEHASKNYYDTGGGRLVEDYAPPMSQEAHKRTHSSLNHQLNEMNFLYELYNTTKEQKYYDFADLLLLGIEQTESRWVLSDNNLNYALMYNGTNNVMTDYPYLTYNDLYATKFLLAQYGRESQTINYLMACKKTWMDSNGITEYNK